jgi:hypothetical protein
VGDTGHGADGEEGDDCSLHFEEVEMIFENWYQED